MKYRAIIIEDDLVAASGLEMMIKKNLDDLKISAKCDTVETAVEKIKEIEPNLIFLDIDLPDGKGFDVIERTKQQTYGVIFTTIHEQYAVKAFEMAAVHYLTKPIKAEMLIEAYQRFIKNRRSDDLFSNLELIKLSMQQNNDRIVLPSANGNKIININDILWCSGDGAYSQIHFVDERLEVISRSLGSLEKALQNTKIIRVHKSSLVNLDYVTGYNLANKSTLKLVNSIQINISNTYRKEFESRISEITSQLN
jgi:two-component system LytT family response regulator